METIFIIYMGTLILCKLITIPRNLLLNLWLKKYLSNSYYVLGTSLYNIADKKIKITVPSLKEKSRR